MAGNNPDIGIDEFPFLAHDKPRPGQIDMIRECRESLRNKGHHIAAAPTGIGKTAASIAAALEVAMNTSTKPHILFLTGRQSQHKIVIETVRKINSRLGNTHRDIKVVDIIGRESMCEVVDIQTGRCLCEQGSSESARARLKEDVRNYILQEPRHVFDIVEKSKTFGVCAWQTCRSAVKDCDILVCDYNHVFAEQVRENSLPSMGVSLQNSIIIVDEAHNLPDRIRMSMERVITPIIVRNAAMELEEFMGSLENIAMRSSSNSSPQLLEDVSWAFEVIKLLRVKMANYFKTLHEKVNEDEESIVKIDDFTKLIHAACNEYEGVSGQMKLDSENDFQAKSPTQNRFEKLAYTLSQVSVEVEDDEDSSEPDAHRISHIVESIIRFGNTTALCMVFSPKGKEGKITTHLLDPGILSGPLFSKSAGSILMSGTLHPPSMYADILALPKNLTTKTSYVSPFAGERRPVLVARDVTTKYNQRSEDMWNKIRAHIQALIEHSEDHIAVFCPSYRLLDEILGGIFFSGVTKITESRDWVKDDIDRVVAKLKNERKNGNRVLLCGVFGARLSEGIDYDDGVLGSVVCIGIPNPPPSVLSDSLKEYISDKFGSQNAWRYTVTQPAINAILQAMGRPIRSVEDRALILLLDNRNDNRIYRECYPHAMKMNTSNDPNSTKAFAKRFFRRVKRV
ncbi:MAG TPA: ATP-dependent DNA helicase [Candidatus Poseidoniaceae archaeon]|nr:MAG TPA: ATP-dependent DNA helicase [Candidatus Poseidoniales archaeon]DAC60815.1 MAG TPA: ATP-dependent DNA helicase [Candidatus Poseidoniales archaeon]HII23858.1 ATP-dependent DNA helicase [Candidatus Poseidoniaceae archaeon]HII50018.1 ATP-dependent DNA helicase [Candidatus Poseidoniaceae archaeon]